MDENNRRGGRRSGTAIIAGPARASACPRPMRPPTTPGDRTNHPRIDDTSLSAFEMTCPYVHAHTGT
ncbi:unnamed protein product [Gadus morhua 'NCC']